jgi:hypothetical protein
MENSTVVYVPWIQYSTVRPLDTVQYVPWIQYSTVRPLDTVQYVPWIQYSTSLGYSTVQYVPATGCSLDSHLPATIWTFLVQLVWLL